MNTKDRIVVVVCALWLIIVSSQNKWWRGSWRSQEDFILWGLLPVAIVLGYLWIDRSRKKEMGRPVPPTWDVTVKPTGKKVPCADCGKLVDVYVEMPGGTYQYKCPEHGVGIRRYTT